MDRVVDPWIGDVLDAFDDVLAPWVQSDTESLDFAEISEVVDVVEDALFWCLLYSHARGAVDVRNRLDVPVATFAAFEPVDAVLAAFRAAGYAEVAGKGLLLQFGEFASVLALDLGHRAYSRIVKSLGDSLSKGETKRQWAEKVGVQSIGITRDNPHYVTNIFRTNTATYYSAGKWHAITEIPEVRDLVEYLEFIAILDDRTTPVCDGMDGTIKTVDDPIWSTHYPPNHYMCRSTVEPISKFENEKVKDPKHLEDPGKGFDTNVGRDYAENVNNINANLISSGLGNEIAARQEEMKNRIISSTLWVDR